MIIDRTRKFAMEASYLTIMVFSLVLVISAAWFLQHSPGLWVFGFIAVIFLAICSSWAASFLTRKQVIILIIVAATLTRLIYLMYLGKEFPVHQITDQLAMLNAGIEVANGNLSAINDSRYFQVWSYQIPYTMLVALASSITDEPAIFLVILNVLISAITALIIYQLTERVYSESAGLSAAMIYCAWPSQVALISILTSQIPAILLLYIGIMILCGRTPNLIIFAIVGAVLSLSVLFRPLAPVIISAVVLYIILLESSSLKKFKLIVSLILGYIIIYLAAIILVETAGVNTHSFKNHNPAWKIAVGLNYQFDGAWNWSDGHEVIRPKELGGSERAMEAVTDRLSTPSKLPMLFARKTLTLLGKGDNTFYYAGIKSNNWKATMDHGYYFGCGILTLVGSIIFYIRRKSFTFAPSGYLYRKNLILYMALFISLYVSAHFIIEIQTWYRIVLYPFMAVMAGITAASFITYMKRIRVGSKGL